MKNKKSLILSICVSLLIVLALFVLPSVDQSVRAQEAGNSLHGYVWSMDVGWISLNANDAGTGTTADYKVEMIDGVLTGYAWSPSLGWLRFGSDLSGPVGAEDDYSARIVEEGGKKWVKGWARFCSVYESNCSGTVKNISGLELGGWDGWLKMVNVEYKPDTDRLEGYSWGDLNVGWVDFSARTGCTPVDNVDTNCNGLVDCATNCGGVCVSNCGGPTPTVECKVTPSSGGVGTEFTWYINNLRNFTGDPKDFTYTWTGTTPLSGSGEWNSVLSRNENKVTYSMSGTKTGGVTVTNGSQTATDSSCNNGIGDGVIVTLPCVNPGGAIMEIGQYCCDSPEIARTVGDICPYSPEDCQLETSTGSNYIRFTEGNGATLSQISAKITMTGCGGSDLSLSTPDLPGGLSLVCSRTKEGSYNAGNCSGLTGTMDIWAGVNYIYRPTGYTFFNNPNRKDLVMGLVGVTPSPEVVVPLLYDVPAGT